jgi:hypothetical protein
MADNKYLDLARSLRNKQPDGEGSVGGYLDVARQLGKQRRKEQLPGAGEAEQAGEVAGRAVSAGLTPFGFGRASEALAMVYGKIFGTPEESQFMEQVLSARDVERQKAGGVRDTVGRTLSGMTAATLRGVATTSEMVIPDKIDPLASVEGFTRGMATTSAVVSDTFTDRVTQAVTNGVANIGLAAVAPVVAAPAFFFQGAGGAANEYDNAFVEGQMVNKDGIYRPSGKYIAALKGGAIEAATEWIGAKAALRIGKSVWGQQAVRSIRGMNPAMKFTTGLALAYGAEAGEEGAASLAYSATRRLQGEQAPEFSDALQNAAIDAFYGGFGGAGAHPFIAISEASQANVMRRRISESIRNANGPFSDEKFWDEMPRATVDALKAMTPDQRNAELQAATSAYHQSNADRQIGAKAVNDAASALEKAQKRLKSVARQNDQAKTDEAKKQVDAAQATFDNAFANQATLAADLLASRTRVITIAAFNARNAPVIQKNAADVMSEQGVTPASATTDSDRAAEQQIRELGYDIQFFDSANPDADPAFYSPASPNTVFLKSGMQNKDLVDALSFAYHEVMHIVQATDSDLYMALRNAFDEQSVVQAGIEYFNNKLRADDRLAQSAAAATMQQVAGVQAMPMQQGEMIEQRAGRTLLEAEGQARVMEDGIRELFRTGKAPGYLGQLIVRMGLRGRQAATALRVRSMLIEAAKQRTTSPAKRGTKSVALTEFGQRVEEAKGVLRGQQLLERPPVPPAAPATPTPAAAPPAAAAAPTAAPVPPSASAAAVTASGMTPAEAAAAKTPDFKAMVNLAVNALRKTNKKWAEGKRLYPIVEAMERDGGKGLSTEDYAIGMELQDEMESQFGKDYSVLWARARGPAATVEQKREKKSGRFVGAPKWVGKSPAKLEKLRATLKALALEGEEGKMWYENSSRAILAAANGDVVEAEKIVALIAIYSPNATVPANTSMALTAYYQFKAGVPINAGFSRADEKATDLLVNGKAWSGIKTNSFYQNLMVEIDPSKLDPGVATMDMWMALAFDYGDKALDQGPKYVFAENEIRRIAAELGWKPHQVQAAIWTAMKGRIDPIRGELRKVELRRGIGEMVTKVDEKTGETTEVYRIKKGREYDHFRLAHKMGMMYALKKEDIAASKYDFSDAINDRMVQMSWEATPSTTTGRSLPGIHRAPIGQQFEYLKAIMDVLYPNGRDVIADLVGLPQGTTITGFSAYMGKIGAGAQTFVPVPLKGAGKKRTFTPEAKKLLNLAALVRGFVMEQDSVVYHAPVWDDAKIRHNGVQIYTKRPLTRNEMDALYSALAKKFNTWELAPGYRNDGARVLNFTDIPNKQFHDGVKAVVEGLPNGFGGGNVELESFRSEGGMLSNDWKAEPNGEGYLAQIESLQPDLLGGVRDLRSRIQAVNNQFDARYGWSTLAARRGGAPRDRVEQPSAGALSPLAGAPVIRGFTGPDPVIVAVAERYAASRGITLRRQSEYADVDIERARRIADAYDKMPHDPQNPAVAEAYRDLIEQTTAQYQALVDAGYEFYFVDLDNDPYADQPGGFGNPYNAVRDLRANRRMAVFPTESGFGSGATDLDVSNNPLLVDTGLQWAFGRPGGPLKRVTANDLFRAVHDAMGHSLEGAGFRARGEENAWQAHVRLFTGAAVGAMTSETRGQNSWLNFGPFGEKNRDAKVEDTTFADQKVGLMPSWTWEEGRVGNVLSARLRSDTTKEITEAFVAEGARFADILVAIQDAVKATVGLHRVKDRTSEDKEFGRVLDLSESVRVDTYKRIRANWSSYRDGGRGSVELQDNQLPVSMQSGDETSGTITKRNDGGLVFAHEMMHAATSLRLDNYAEKYADKKVRESGHDRYSDLGVKVAKRWAIRGVSGKKYIENLERYSADPDVDPAFKELVDCFLESAKSVPDQYERMINGKRTTPSVRFNNADGSARIFVRPSAAPILRPELVATLSAESQREYGSTSLELVVEAGGKEFVVDRRPSSKASVIEETAKNLREGKPVLREALYLVSIESWSGQSARVLFRQNNVNIAIPGFEPVHEYSGGGLVNRDNGGDAMSADGGLYAFGNLHEFVAEAINDPKFQNILRSLPSKGRGAGSMFSRLMQTLRRFLGIEDAVPMSMLDDLMNLTEELARTDIVAAIGQAQRRSAVTGEVAAPKQKALTLEGFPVVGGLTGALKKGEGGFTLAFQLPGVTLDVVRPIGSRDQPAKVVLYDKNNITVRMDVELVDGKWTLWSGSSGGYGSNSVDFGEMYSPTVFPSFGESATSIDGKPFGKTKTAVIKDLAELAKRMVAISSQRQIEGAQQYVQSLQRDGYTNVTFEDKRGQPYTRSDAVTVTRLSARRRVTEGRADRRAGLAYRIGRREGLLSGEVQGQKVAKREEKRIAERMVREERNKQKVEAQAKRTEMRSAFRDRVAGLMLEIESAAAANEELRNRIKVMRKYERAGKAVAARKAESAVLKAWIKGLYRGRAAGKAEGIAEAKKTMTDIRKAAVQVIATLPPKLRGKYVNAVATMKTAAGINKIARRVVQDLAMAEAIETVAAINRMEKRVRKVGLRAETRTDLRSDLSAARSLLASGRKRMLPFTDTADLASRTEAARRLLESAVQRFDVEREEYRDARDARADEAVADAAALGATLATLPKLKQGRLSSMAPKRGVLKDILSTVGNSDIYTLMQAIEGGTNGVLGKMWAGFSEAKGNMTLDRKRIDEKIDAALRSVGYSGYDGYATNASGLYGESSAETVTVALGGNPMTITVDQMLHLAAFDDDTVALLTDATDPNGTLGAPIVFSTYRNSPRIYMTRQEFADIRSNLTNGQRQLIDQMKAILEQDIRPRAFEIHFQIHGRQPDLVAGYFPRQRLGDEISGEAIDVNAMPSAVMNTMLSNAGFLQQRVAAKSTLVVGGMMRTMDSHLDESLRLIHLSMPLRYAMSVLKNGAVRAGIESTMGDGGNDMIRKLVLNGVGLSGRAQGGLIEGINANISGALITLNPKTWLRQLGGAFRLMSEMPAGAWAKGVAQMVAMTPAQRRDMAREIESMNGYFYDRHRRSQVGIFANVLGDPNTAKDRWAASFSSSARSMAAVGESLAAGKFARAARDIREGVLPISRVLKTADGVLRTVDRQIMLAAFLGSRADVMVRNPSMTPAEVNVAAAKLAELAFRKTQNVSDPLDDTVYAAQQKFSQGIGRLMFPFSSDPLKGYNQIRRAVASGDSALIAKTAVGVTSNMALSAAVNPLWTAAGIAIANALGGGGDEEDEEMIKQMAMEQEYSYIQPRLASDAAAAVFGYLGMLGGGIVDGALGSAERADDVMEPLVVRFFGDISQYAAKGDLPSLSSTAMQMAGIPVVAPATTVTGVLKKAAPSDRKLLEYYRKLGRAGELTAKQRQRLNVLAARERIRLAQERREKQLQQ